MVTVCEAAGCGKAFQVNAYSSRCITGSDAGKILCPHCGHETAGASDSVYLTHAVLPEADASQPGSASRT